MQIIKELVDDLNQENIGQKTIDEVEGMISQYREFGLEERQVSALIEPVALKQIFDNKKLAKKYNLSTKAQNTRPFYDLLVGKIPVDFKASKCVTSDNLSAQGALLYIVSGDINLANSEKRLDKNYLEFFIKLSQDAIKKNIDIDFPYLILNKQSNFFDYCTLRTISVLGMNQNNFLQCNWGQNLGIVKHRTIQEWIDWIMPQLLSYRHYDK